MLPRLNAATSEVDKIAYARHWQGGNPHYIACLRDLTNVMPDDGETYLMSFDLHEDAKTKDLKGMLSGKTRSNNSVLAVRSRMTASKHFDQVTPSMQDRPARGGSEVTFTINFRYIGHD